MIYCFKLVFVILKNYQNKNEVSVNLEGQIRWKTSEYVPLNEVERKRKCTVTNGNLWIYLNIIYFCKQIKIIFGILIKTF